MAVQEALDADEHPDMLDFSDAADGLQRTTSNVSSSSDMQHSRHGGTLAPPPPPTPPHFPYPPHLFYPANPHSASSHALLLIGMTYWCWWTSAQLVQPWKSGTVLSVCNRLNTLAGCEK